MIRIDRTASPPVLKNRRTGNTSYRNKTIVAALYKMQFQKCCYSEMKIPSSGQGQAVEHFRPKSIFKGLRTEWDNLLLVCPNCNGQKSNKFPVMLTDDRAETKVIYTKKPTKKRAAIINPADPKEFPERELTYELKDIGDFWYGQIKPRNGSVKGRQTIEITGIGDDFFRKKRSDRLRNYLVRALCDLMEAYENDDKDGVRDVKARFRRYMRPNAEFAGLAREFARSHQLDKRFQLQIPKRNE
jgi:uncharacterized protein (TIGR02646 family)